MKQTISNISENPLVSIIVPFFNREEFLSEAIESVLAQSYENWELILVDDGSQDKSYQLAESFVERFPQKIKLFAHEDNQNKGASAARRLGINNAVGEYLTFLDSDDVFFPDTLERELKAFRENPEADVVCGTLECWYSWSKEAEKWERDFVIDLVLDLEKLYQPPALLVHNFDSGGRKPGINSVMLKMDFARRVKIFEENYKYAWEDQFFWAKVSLNGKIYVMDACLAKYRQHPASICLTESESGQDIVSMNVFLELLEDYLKEQGIRDKEVWQALKKFQRNVRVETKLKKLKQMYRQRLPLHTRYWLRDQWIRFRKK